jgi:hypothetical protein
MAVNSGGPVAGDQCTEHGEAIARLEVRMGALEREIPEKLDRIIQQTELTNGRLRRVEMWRAWLTGGVVFTLAALSAAGTVWAMLK